MMKSLSPLERKRITYKPKIPKLLNSFEDASFEKVKGKKPEESLRPLFPNTFETPCYHLKKGKGKKRKLKIGVLFSGGPAAGGHNVIAGIFDAGAELIGFLNGPSGLVENQTLKIEKIDSYRNQGGFDLLGTGRTKIETEEQLLASLKTCVAHKLDGLVIIGGDDSNTNAAILAEFFIENGCETKVIGVPKTIDGDLRSEEIEISFGFDTATKTYSELIGNIARDALSTKKYYHFIKLMGRSASHVVLECALRTQPNLALIGEERRPFDEIIGEIADLIIKRSEVGKNYGVILIPEGLVEFVPELDEHIKGLSLEKDAHGNIELSKIETDKLILSFVEKELKKRAFKGKFSAQTHFLGYEGRSCMPSNFDADYGTALGVLAYLAIREELTGVICSIQNIKESFDKWEMQMVPIVQLMHLEKRLGKQKPVIKKTLVDLKGKPFIKFSTSRRHWEIDDKYQYPGPIQFFGEADLTDSVPLSL